MQYVDSNRHFLLEVLMTEFCKKQLSVFCLGNPKLNGGSTIRIIEGKMTLVQVCEVT